MFIHTLLPRRAKAYFLLFANFVFYGHYSIPMLIFMVVFALMVYLATLRVNRQKKHPAMFVLLWIAGIVGLYFLLRYSNLLNSLLSFIVPSITWQIVFPLGFSYAMFKCIGYLVDVYHKKMEPNKRFDHFLVYVLYFPEVTMGPLTRANEFLPQLGTEKPLDNARLVQGFSLILWGFFKKLIFADRLAVLIAPYYANVASLDSGIGWLLVCMAYFVQLYLDFSGYTDIAFGISKVLGYDTRHNFLAPMTAQTMSEYWRKWHTSLSSWLSDYVFTPLQFKWRKLGIYASALAAVVTLSISGVWHSVSLGFVLWGFIMGVCVAIDALLAKRRKKLKKKMPTWLFVGMSVAFTFLLNVLMLSFTRAASANDAFEILGAVFTKPWNTVGVQPGFFVVLLLGFVVSIASQFLEVKRDRFFLKFEKTHIVLRWAIYFILLFAIILFSVNADLLGGFIYAQF